MIRQKDKETKKEVEENYDKIEKGTVRKINRKKCEKRESERHRERKRQKWEKKSRNINKKYKERDRKRYIEGQIGI